MLETLTEHPHLNTAAMLERARDTDYEGHLQRLALQPLSLSPEQLKPELAGLLLQLQQQAIAERHEYLEQKGLRNLTEVERIEYLG
jgi:DNA primase